MDRESWSWKFGSDWRHACPGLERPLGYSNWLPYNDALTKAKSSTETLWDRERERKCVFRDWEWIGQSCFYRQKCIIICIMLMLTGVCVVLCWVGSSTGNLGAMLTAPQQSLFFLFLFFFPSFVSCDHLPRTLSCTKRYSAFFFFSFFFIVTLRNICSLLPLFRFRYSHNIHFTLSIVEKKNYIY